MYRNLFPREPKRVENTQRHEGLTNIILNPVRSNQVGIAVSILIMISVYAMIESLTATHTGVMAFLVEMACLAFFVMAFMDFDRFRETDAT